MHRRLNTVVTPLNTLEEADLCPGQTALADLNARLR
jgi:hypothetical protein